MTLKNLLLIICLLYITLSYGQDLSFKNINHSNGLSSNLIYAASEGPDGLLWIIAEYKLNSYYNGKVEKYSNAEIEEIEDYNLIEIEIDQSNIIWLRTTKNKALFLDKNRKLKVVKKEDGSDLKILNYLLSSILIFLWLLANRNLFYISLDL
ncbi:MAG: hypothetical protein AAGK97_01475 [Bacteroidota bacterium]